MGATRQIGQLIILASILLAFTGTRPSQEKSAVATRPMPFGSAEELVFVGEYTRFLIRGADIADLRMRIFSRREDSTTEESGVHPAYEWRISAHADSKGFLSKLFGVSFHYTVDSTVDSTSFSALRTNRQTEQKGRRVASQFVFEPSTGEAVWTETDLKNPQSPPKKATFTFNGRLQDIVSVIYFTRTLQLTPGQRYEVPVTDWGEVYRLPLKVIERKELKTVLGEMVAVRVDVGVFGKGRLLGGEGEMSVWFSDDARHIPVKAQLDFGYGRIDIKLTRRAEGAAVGIEERVYE
jgi:hypothetical protein